MNVLSGTQRPTSRDFVEDVVREDVARAVSVELIFVSGTLSLSYLGCKFPGNCPCSSGLDLHFTELCPKWLTASEVLECLTEFPCSWSPTHHPPASTPFTWGQPVVLRETHFFKDRRFCSFYFTTNVFLAASHFVANSHCFHWCVNSNNPTQFPG